LINDHIDVAIAVDADGVQLRADHLPIAVARRLLGPDAIIGVSTHSLGEVREAQEADFVLFGPVFATPSKREYGPPLGLEALREAAAVSGIPVFAIGGVTAERVAPLRASGAAGVAAIGALLRAPQVREAAALMIAALRRAPALTRS
jgi:thiamine-phosphate pyrophosphorylase